MLEFRSLAPTPLQLLSGFASPRALHGLHHVLKYPLPDINTILQHQSPFLALCQLPRRTQSAVPRQLRRGTQILISPRESKFLASWQKSRI